MKSINRSANGQIRVTYYKTKVYEIKMYQSCSNFFQEDKYNILHCHMNEKSGKG